MRKFIKLTVAVFIIFAAIFWWIKLGAPYSYQEYKILRNFKNATVSQLEIISLSTINPNDWDLACGNSGYDEPIFIEKYNKYYPAVGQLQDAAWGIVFIKKDGSFDAVSSYCSFGFYVDFKGERCLSRDRANFFMKKNNDKKTCSVVFSVVN